MTITQPRAGTAPAGTQLAYPRRWAALTVTLVAALPADRAMIVLTMTI